MKLLGMFARQPVSGKTKTRLAATIGNDPAAVLYSAFVEDLLGRCPLHSDVFVVAATPNDSETSDWFRSRMNAESALTFQPDGNLGEKIEWFFQDANKRGAQKTILIGSDSPDLPSEIIDLAFERLSEVDMVIVPATDGGFVLIGLRKPVKNLFSSISWSSGRTLIDTLQQASVCQLTVELLSPWYDIDTVQNLGTLVALQQCPETGAAACLKTQAALKLLAPEIDAGLDIS